MPMIHASGSREDRSEVFVVAVLPDDEALGCGGTIVSLSEVGATVRVIFLALGVGLRETNTSPRHAW